MVKIKYLSSVYIWLCFSEQATKFAAEQDAIAIKIKDEAEAEAIRLKLNAEAEGLDKKAEAMLKMKEAAVVDWKFN